MAWRIRYRLESDTEIIGEDFATKEMARDRFFTIRAYKGVNFVELRNPRGQIWFRDHWFEQEHTQVRNEEAGADD
jgi:hypothetical protein